MPEPNWGEYEALCQQHDELTRRLPWDQASITSALVIFKYAELPNCWLIVRGWREVDCDSPSYSYGVEVTRRSTIAGRRPQFTSKVITNISKVVPAEATSGLVEAHYVGYGWSYIWREIYIDSLVVPRLSD